MSILKLNSKQEIAQSVVFLAELETLKRYWDAANMEALHAKNNLRNRELEIGALIAPAKPGQVIEWTEIQFRGRTRRNRMIIGRVEPQFVTEVQRDENGAVIMDDDGETPKRFAGVYFRFYGLRVLANDSLGERCELSTKYVDSPYSVYRPDEDPVTWIKPSKDDPRCTTIQEQLTRWLPNA